MAEANSGFKISAIITAVVVAVVLAWIASTKSTGEDVTTLKPQIERLKEDVKRLETWQMEWQRNGELPADVRQSKDIEFLKIRISNIKIKVAELEKQVHDILIKQAEAK